MSVVRCLCLVAVALLGAGQETGVPSFEVASVRPVETVPPKSGMLGRIRVDKSQVTISSISALDLLVIAFRVAASNIDGPAWLGDKAFAIQAKIPDNGRVDQLPELLQTLCVKRFGLKFHREARMRPVYSLVAAKGGPKLKAATSAAAAVSEEGGSLSWSPIGPIQMVGDEQGPPQMVGKGFRTQMRDQGIEFVFSTTGGLAAFLAAEADRPVVDNTGVHGNYEIALPAPMAQSVHGNGSPDEPGPFTAGLDQLGLKMISDRAQVDTIVIDSMNMTPDGN